MSNGSTQQKHIFSKKISSIVIVWLTILQVMNAVVTMVDTAPAILHIHVYVGMVGLDCCVTLLFVIHHVITQEYVSDLMSVPVNQVTQVHICQILISFFYFPIYQEPAVKKPHATLPVRMEVSIGYTKKIYHQICFRALCWAFPMSLSSWFLRKILSKM